MQFLTEEHWAALLEAARVGAEEKEERIVQLQQAPKSPSVAGPEGQW